MAPVVGELEGLISNHNLLVSRGQVVEAARVKGVIGEYLSQKDRANRLYKGVWGKFEEFLYCAENNFERFQEIINYKHLTQLEYFYPEYSAEFRRELKKSAQKLLQLGGGLYSALLVASSLSAEENVLHDVLQGLVGRKSYQDLQRLFDRLGETRQQVLAFNAQLGRHEDVPLVRDEEVRDRIGRLLFEAYSEETKRMEGTGAEFSTTRNAFRLASLLSNHLPELGLITDGSLISTATIYFKELARRVDLDSTGELVDFLTRFKANPAVRRFMAENPETFQSYLNSPDVREVLTELARNLLGKTRFDEVRRLAESLEGILSLAPTFRSHLASLKENGFFIQAIEMAEKLQLTEALTDDLKVEAFRKLLDELVDNPQKPANYQRVKKFAAKHRIGARQYPQLEEEILNRLEGLEKRFPELHPRLDPLYGLLQVERRKKRAGGAGGLGLLFDPIIWFFTLFFKVFVALVMIGAGRQSAAPPPGRQPGRSSRGPR